MESGRRSNFGASAHAEPYRVVADALWPRSPNSTHNARCFGGRDEARAAYLHLLVSQLHGERELGRVALEAKGADGRYSPVLESFRRAGGPA